MIQIQKKQGMRYIRYEQNMSYLDNNKIELNDIKNAENIHPLTIAAWHNSAKNISKMRENFINLTAKCII